jgi:hypothetical protein
MAQRHTGPAEMVSMRRVKIGGVETGSWRISIRTRDGNIEVNSGLKERDAAEAWARERIARMNATEAAAGEASTGDGSIATPSSRAPGNVGHSTAGASPPNNVASIWSARPRTFREETEAGGAAAAAPARAPRPTLSGGHTKYTPAEQRELAQMLGSVFSAANKGIVGWSVRMMGRIPDPPTDKEEAVLDKAWAMQVEKWADGRELSPIIVIAGASVGMGIGMYTQGKPIPKKPAPVLTLVPEGARPAVAAEQPAAPEPAQPAPAAPSTDGGASGARE